MNTSIIASRLVRPCVHALTAAVLSLAIVASASAADLSGCWEGCWRSCSTGHHGKLRATITKVDDSRYCAQFTGTFFRIIPFRYSTMLVAIEDGDSVKLSGESYLGRLMGTFYYDGTATDCTFDMNYSSCKDCGVFQMRRATPCGCCP
ncbi:MAG: hypothetical protein WD875_08385 [Pirellulales bacterium]